MSYNKNNNHSADKNPSVKTTLIRNNDNNSREHLTVRVSRETFAYLKCLQELDVLWTYVFEALELYWGSETADTIMNEEYLDKDLVLRAIIEKYLCFSIGCNVNAINEITEI